MAGPVVGNLMNACMVTHPSIDAKTQIMRKHILSTKWIVMLQVVSPTEQSCMLRTGKKALSDSLVVTLLNIGQRLETFRMQVPVLSGAQALLYLLMQRVTIIGRINNTCVARGCMSLKSIVACNHNSPCNCSSLRGFIRYISA